MILPPRADAEHRLPDGRVLAYAEYGDAGGRPVVYFHGWPGCRLEGAQYHEACVAARVRLICVDRPGFGRSTRKRSRKIVEWASDVAALADALGVQRFSVVGYSGGGPHALSCARGLGERLDGVAVVGGVAPLVTAKTSRWRRAWVRVVRAAAPLSHGTLLWFRANVRLFGRRAIAASRFIAPEADRRILARPRVQRAFAAELRESLARGTGGAVDELRLFASPWGFELSEVRVRVHWWHGTKDRVVPFGRGRSGAEALPDCERHYIDGAAHMMIIDLMPDVLREV